MRKTTRAGLFSLMFLIFLFHESIVLGQQVYDLEVVAKTGTALGTAAPSALGTGPSINDAGKVLFIARDSADPGDGRVMLLNNGVIERDCPVGVLAMVSDAVQVNNSDQGIFRMRSDDNLFSDIVRLDASCGGPILGKGSMSSQFPQPFDVVLPGPALNNTGRGVFSGDVGSNTRLGSRADGTGAYNLSPFLTGFPNLFPMLADNNTTVVRWGAAANSPLLRFIDTATTFNTANFIADSTNFNAIGEQPGMSDDGNVVAFVGDQKTTGLGIYVSLFAGTTFAPIKVIGLGGAFSNFSLQARVGVNRSSPGSVTDYTLAYIGFSALGKLGLYTTAIDITDPAAPVVSTPSLVAEAGDAIAGLTGTVNNIRIYDPVNNKGEVVFWVSTDTGIQAIVKAIPSTIDAFDPACDFLSTVCDGSFLKDSNGKIIVDDTKLDSIAAANIQRGGIVTDGVTKLFLRIKTNEPVTFVLKNPLGQTADNKWGVLSDLTETTQGNTITINPVTTGDGPAAFAVYHAPVDLPCSYNTAPCTASEIAGSLRVRVEASSVSSTWKKSLNLLPPPLVLVHGVWSNVRAWLDMAGFLEQKGFIVCPGCLVDYGTNSSAGSFDPLDPDAYIIKELINSTKRALTFMRLNNIAATQVDVVGHSMGGLVARAVTVFNDAVDQYKARKNYNKGSFHKIITVGTPHLGTQIADFLISNKCKKFLSTSVFVTLEDFFTGFKRPIGPAIFGFQTASPALQHLASTQVPSHAIIGLAPPSSVTEEALNFIIRTFVSPSENVDHIIDLNGNGHDTIVPRESQEGGVNPLATSRALADVVHADLTNGLLDTGETESQVVWDEVTRLLLALTTSLEFDTLPQVTGLGTPTFPVNPYIAPSVCPASAQSTAISAATATLQPAAGTTFTPGQTVNVQFEVAGGNPVEGALFTVGNKLEGIEGPGPFAFSFPAPADHIGDMDVTAYTFGPGPENYTSATTITILPAGPFVKISSLTDFLPMDQMGLSLQINVRGYYADGSSVNITKAGTGTLYSVQSGTANVITVNPDGLVQAQGAGSDVVLITNRGQSTSVSVEVKLANQPPVFVPITDKTVNEGQLLQFNVSASDPDANPLVLSARLGSGAGLSTIGASFTDNGNGTGVFSWTPGFAQSGTYTLVFQASDGLAIDEETITVTVNDVAAPDLLLTALSTTTTAIAPGNPLSAANTVRNQGTAAAGAFINAFRLSTDAAYGNADDIVFTTTRSIASLAVGASSSATTSNLTVPATTPAGDYFLCAKADNNATVLEQDENNNTRCATATVKVAPADLIMTAISAPAGGLTGAKINVSDTVRNQGQGSITASFIVGFYLSPDAVITTADTRIGTRTVSSLAANVSQNKTTTVTIPSTLAPGTYYIGAIADYANVRLELDENNNSLAGNTINVTPGADLVISAVSAPATGSTANTISVTTTVNNQGLGAAGSFSIGLYLSSDAAITTADIRLGTRSVNALAIGAASTGSTTVTIPNTQAPGTYYIGAIADYLNARPESNEANNSLAGNQINVVSPDLVMTAVSGPASGARGGTISLSNTAGNQGAGNAASFTIGLYLSTDATITTADRRVGTRTVSTLASGATNAAATTVTIPSTLAVGTYYVGAIADYNNTRAETNETNNALAGNTITVQ